MDFIALMKEVWMASEMRKQQEEAWARQREALQLQNNGREQGQGNTPSGSTVTGPESNVSAGSDTKCKRDFRSELNEIVNGMSGGARSLITETGDSQSMGDMSMPPAYDQYMNLSAHASQTDVKQPISNDASALHGGSSADSGGESLTSEEKAELLDIIKKLSDEQQSLRTKLSEHDKRLESLLNKKPSIRQRLSANSQQTLFTSKMPVIPMNALTETVGNKHKNAFMDDEKVYAQIEQLYANLYRLHFPQPKTAAQCITKDDDQIYCNPVSSEMALRLENKCLNEKITQLENRLKEKHGTSAETKIIQESHNIESLKFTTYIENSASAHYKNFTATPEDTTDFNTSHRPCRLSEKDVQQVSSAYEWRISNYFQKLELEKRGTIFNTTSEPLFIGGQGYRARLEAYLNGNGSGHDKCMSIFLRIIKGPYDEYLKWPVKFSLTFILVNQEVKPNDSLVQGRDDNTTFTYTRPTGDSYENSDSWGLIEFVPHTVINKRKYIKDNTIMLKIKIINR